MEAEIFEKRDGLGARLAGDSAGSPAPSSTASIMATGEGNVGAYERWGYGTRPTHPDHPGPKGTREAGGEGDRLGRGVERDLQASRWGVGIPRVPKTISKGEWGRVK